MSTEVRMAEDSQHTISSSLLRLDEAVLDVIVAQKPLPCILESLCLKLEERSPGLLCSVLLLDPDGETLRHGAAPSLPPDYASAIDGAKIGPRAGSCGSAVHRRELVVVEDILGSFRSIR